MLNLDIPYGFQIYLSKSTAKCINKRKNKLLSDLGKLKLDLYASFLCSHKKMFLFLDILNINHNIIKYNEERAACIFWESNNFAPIFLMIDNFKHQKFVVYIWIDPLKKVFTNMKIIDDIQRMLS